MCRSGCPSQDHESWGACARAAKLQASGGDGRDMMNTIHWEQNYYAKARESGLQPDGCRKADVDRAWRISDAVGAPYRGDA